MSCLRGEDWVLSSCICAVVGMCSLHNRVEDSLCDVNVCMPCFVSKDTMLLCW